MSALSVNSMKLSEIQNHAAACVNCLELDGAMRRRLQDIGFVPGARICFAYRSPLGDPNAYFIGGALIALRPVGDGKNRCDADTLKKLHRNQTAFSYLSKRIPLEKTLDNTGFL